jgi:hypothetical protein
MSEYQFTDKQINNFIKRCKDKKRWLNTRHVRSGNMPAVELRQLMKMVVDRELAFDNGFGFENEKYEICFELEHKRKMLEELEDARKISLSNDSDVFNLAFFKSLSKSLYDDCRAIEEAKACNIVLSQMRIIYDAFYTHQHGGNVEDINFTFTSYVLSEKDSQRMNSYLREFIFVSAYILIDMYYALMIGWEEVKDISNYSTCNELFMELFISQHIKVIISIYSLGLQNLSPKYRSLARNAWKIVNFNKFVKSEIENLANHSNDIQSKTYYQSLLAEYDLDPHGQGLQNAVNALKELAYKDIGNEYILDTFQDLYKADRAFPGYEIPSNHKSNISEIKIALGQSSNSRIKKALSDWRKSEYRVTKLVGAMTKWFADHPETRP